MYVGNLSTHSYFFCFLKIKQSVEYSANGISGDYSAFGDTGQTISRNIPLRDANGLKKIKILDHKNIGV